MKYFLTFILFMSMSICYSQINRYFGGCGNENAQNLIISGNRIHILGISNSFDWGDGDVYSILLDTLGNVKWSKTYRIDHKDETPSKLLNWNTNQIIIIGGNGNGWHSPYLASIDSLGDILWSIENNRFRIRDFIKSKSNKLIVCGDFPSSEGFPPSILVLDSLGNMISSTYYSFTPNNLLVSEGFYTKSIIQDADSNYLISGNGFVEIPNYTYAPVFFTIKLDRDLNILWSRVFNYRAENLAKIICTTNNEYLLAGHTYNNSFILKLSNNGDFIWLKELSIDGVTDFVETSNNEYLLLTRESSLVKFDSNFNIIWSYIYDSTNYYDVYASSIIETNDRYFLLKTSISNPISDSLSPSGYRKDILIVEIDTNGNSNVPYSGINANTSSIIIDTLEFEFSKIDSIIPFSSISFTESHVHDSFSDSLDCIGVGISSTIVNPEIKLYPNPNHGTFKIEINGYPNQKLTVKVYNLLGSILQQAEYNSGDDITINLENSQKGILIVNIKFSDFSKTVKINCL